VNLQAYSLNTEVRLIPVIEMMPSNYGHADRPMPPPGDTEAWTQYWYECLADSGIEELRLLDLWHVPIEQLTNANTLERIIHENRFDEASDSSESDFDRFSDPDEYLSAFNGGYALYLNDRKICTPRCCADLADIQNWQLAADYRRAEWDTIWIGHPSINVYYDGTHLVFIDQDEGNGHTEWSGELVIVPDVLQKAIERAKQELLDFYRRLLPIVESMVPPSQAVQITKILTASNPI
jgi:hypothetical protein